MKFFCQNRDKAVATKFCNCSGSTVHYCDSCYMKHVTQSHELSHGAEASTTDVYCYKCNRQTTKFCICEDTLPNVCDHCEAEHRQTEELHWLFPITIKFRMGTEESIEFLRNKVLYYMGARGKLKHNLEKIKRCKELVEKNFEKLNGNANPVLVQEKNREIANLEATREALSREIANGLREVKEHLLEEDFVSDSGITKAIFQFHCLEDMDSLDFFTFKSTIVGVDSDAKLGVEWECRLREDRKVNSCWLKAGARLLPLLHTNNVCYLTPATLQKRIVKLSGNIPDPAYAIWTFLPDGSLMAVGFYSGAGGIGRVDTVIIELTGTARRTCNLLSPRHSPGAICLGDWVYCFGGFNGVSLSSCEKYRLDSDTWNTMKNMGSARHYFNLIEYGGFVYVCGGNTVDCEVFTPTTGEFAYLDFKLSESSDTATFLYEQEIIILTISGVTVYNPTTKKKTRAFSSTGRIMARCGPVVINNTVFFVQTPAVGGVDGFKQLDLTTFSFKENILLT